MVGGWRRLAVGGWWSSGAVHNNNTKRKIGVLKDSPGHDAPQPHRRTRSPGTRAASAPGPSGRAGPTPALRRPPPPHRPAASRSGSSADSSRSSVPRAAAAASRAGPAVGREGRGGGGMRERAACVPSSRAPTDFLDRSDGRTPRRDAAGATPQQRARRVFVQRISTARSRATTPGLLPRGGAAVRAGPTRQRDTSDDLRDPGERVTAGAVRGVVLRDVDVALARLLPHHPDLKGSMREQRSKQRAKASWVPNCQSPFISHEDSWARGGATTTGPDATPPPAICQNLGAGGEGGVLPAWRRGGGGGLRATHYYNMHTSRGCLGAWGYRGMYAIIAISCLCQEESLKGLKD